MAKQTKYIFVVGGVLSGVGKGVTVSSIAFLLQSQGFKVSPMKIDPYVNVDAGTMNPIEHGEVFVTDDADETDQDIGNYERFLNQNLSKLNYMTTGRVYQSVIQKERNLYYEGRCVEVVPHVPQEVIRRIRKCAKETDADFVVVEIGGTVGEYQNILFVEAARLMKLRHPEEVSVIMVSYLPVPGNLGEMKSKPTQEAVMRLVSTGLMPDFIIGRSRYAIDDERKRKIAMRTGVQRENIISAPDVASIYEVPFILRAQDLDKKILNLFGMRARGETKDFFRMQKLSDTIKKIDREVTIGLVEKYYGSGDFSLSDAYLSVVEAVKHACWSLSAKPNFVWFAGGDIEKNKKKLDSLSSVDAVIVPGGFGKRGVEGKIKAIEYVRKNSIPYLGLCYGLQLSVVEFARNVLKLTGANTEENEPDTAHPVIHILPEQVELMEKKNYGNTMRLGAYDCRIIDKKSKTSQYYKKEDISERHRHRFEVNNDYINQLQKKGFLIVGKNIERNLVEIMELSDHPYFIGSQFHPELKSRPLHPHPLFIGLIEAALKRKKEK